MRLRSLIPSLPAELLTLLEQCGIRTDSDLLYSGSPIDVLALLPASSATLSELERLIGTVLDKVAAPGVSAAEILGKQADHANVRTGIPEVDELINGLGGPCVLEVSGAKRSGKTVSGLDIV